MKRTTHSRREFLSRAAAAGAAGALGGCATKTARPSPLAAKPDRSAPVAKPASRRHVVGANDRIRCGMIGPGSRGSALLRAALDRKDVDVVAVSDAYDVWLDRAVNWCNEKKPGTGEYVRFEEMLETEELDAVIIAAPDHVHAPAILAALDAGLDVYTEKPMTLTREEAKRVRDRANETGAVVQVGTQLRCVSIYQKAREAVQSGEIGKLALVQVNRHFQSADLVRKAPPEEANASNVHWKVFLRDTKPYPFDLARYFLWRKYAEYSNGFAGDLMCHHLDLCHFITGCGMPDRVMSVGGIYFYEDGRSCPDTMSVLAEYPENFQFNYTSTAVNGHYGLVERYLGSEGTIELRNMSEMTIYKGDIKETVKSEGILDAPHVGNFFDCMRTRAKTIAPVEAGFMAATVIHMAVESEQSGHAAQWDSRSEEAVI